MEHSKGWLAKLWQPQRFSQLLCCGVSYGWIMVVLSCSTAALAAESLGRFIQPQEGYQAKTNLLLAVEAQDNDGIAQVLVTFNHQAQLLLCDSEISCGGSSFSHRINNFDPHTLKLAAGRLQLQLWITDRFGRKTQVASTSIHWQPPSPGTLQVQRSSDGKSLSVRWDPSPSLLRYNLYLASVSGVNRANYKQLPDGQAVLAQKSTAAQFNALDPLKDYYLFITGLSGSGETALTPEIVVQSLRANKPPVAMNDSYSGRSDQTLTVNAEQGLLANDVDPDADPLSVQTSAITPAQFGTLQLFSNGSFSYVPNAGFRGTDSFVYQISDSRGGVAQARVQLTIAPRISNLAGQSTSLSGEFYYIGQGADPVGSQVGTGLYRIGDCVQLVDTRCSMLGRYTESAQSGNAPGQQGSYALMMTYPGTGQSPVLARSISANNNSVQFVRTGQARFELSLFPDSGGQYQGLYPNIPFADSLGFAAFIGNTASCSGLSGGLACSIGQVGQVAGAEMRAPLDRLSFTIPGSALDRPGTTPPIATNDSYQAGANQTFAVAAPGVLGNDNDGRNQLQGNSLNIRHRFNPGLGALVGLAANEYQQRLFLYPEFAANIHQVDRRGAALGSFARQGEAANDVDVDIAAQAFLLKDVRVPQGTLLFFNGETNETEVFALDPQTGALLSRLDTAFGASHVVGGAFNSKTGTLWLLQDNVPAANIGNQVAQIDPVSGRVINSFGLVTATHSFSVSFGDLHVNPVNGNLLIASSIQSAIAEFDQSGKLIRQMALPAGVGNISGLSASADGKTFWLAATTGEVVELGFANQAPWPSLTATLLQAPANGVVVLKPDGSFSYTPNRGFTGSDSFTYQLAGAFGGNSQGTVQLDVR